VRCVPTWEQGKTRNSQQLQKTVPTCVLRRPILVNVASSLGRAPRLATRLCGCCVGIALGWDLTRGADEQ